MSVLHQGNAGFLEETGGQAWQRNKFHRYKIFLAENILLSSGEPKQ